jgi:hypothetical protein
MDFFYPLAGIFLLVGTPVYLHAVVKLHGIIQSQEPSWLAGHRSNSIFYSGFPEVADPNINLRVVWLAFGTRWQRLDSPSATKYVRRIQVLLPTLTAVFVGVLIATVVTAP